MGVGLASKTTLRVVLRCGVLTAVACDPEITRDFLRDPRGAYDIDVVEMSAPQGDSDTYEVVSQL